MRDKDNTVNDNDTRLDANGMEERKDIDTRRWKAEDNNGHITGSRQANGDDEDTREQRKHEDESELNKLDDRETATGNEAV